MAPGLSLLLSSAILTVSKTHGNASSPLLYGIMFEVRIVKSRWGSVLGNLQF